MSFNYFKAIDHVATYYKFRPNPPKEMIQRIVSFLKEGGGSPNVAIDVGCGSGQSTTSLGPFFSEVVGIEPSAEAVKLAEDANTTANVSFRVNNAEKLPFKNGSVDLVTATQAVHWFDKLKFYSEAERILGRHGVIALCGYRLPFIKTADKSSGLSSIIKKFYCEDLDQFVLTESRQAYLNNYKDSIYMDIPFVEGKRMTWEDGFTTEIEVNASEIAGYFSSMSGFQNLVEQKGEEAGKKLLRSLEDEFVASLGKEATSSFIFQYQYFVLLGRKAG